MLIFFTFDDETAELTFKCFSFLLSLVFIFSFGYQRCVSVLHV